MTHKGKERLDSRFRGNDEVRGNLGTRSRFLAKSGHVPRLLTQITQIPVYPYPVFPYGFSADYLLYCGQVRIFQMKRRGSGYRGFCCNPR
jgi:hypothetical protein